MAATPGLWASARGIAGALLEVGRTRLQLASVELEEERLRLADLVLWATLALYSLALGIVFGALAVVLLVPVEARALALGVMAVCACAVGIWAAWVWRRKSRAKAPILSATLDELARDVAAVGGAP